MAIRIDDFPRDLGDSEASLTAVLNDAESSSLASNPSSLRSGPQPPPPENLRIASVFQRARQTVPNNEALMEFCRNFVDQLQAGAAPWVVQRLNNTYGPMPTDPSNFSFWMALVSPPLSCV